MKVATRPSKAKAAKPSKGGFGAKPVSKPKKQRVITLDPAVQAAIDELQSGEQSIERYFNPALFEDPQTMSDISARLRAGEVVIIRDAFRPEFAEMVFAELSAKGVAWELNEAYCASRVRRA